MLNYNLVMFFTGFTRFSSDIQKANNAGESNENKIKKLKEMYSLVDEAEKNSDLDEFGRLLDYTWKLKRTTGEKVSTESIDALYKKGIEAGALGGKLLGAGGGGFLIFYVKPENKQNLINAMSGLLHVPFEFENGGSRIIQYTAEDYEG